MLERMLVFALLPLAAHAATILYSDSGTFSGSTPSTAFSAPNQTWAFSFQADSNPSIVEFGNGGFDFAFSNFSYVLNGSPVAITPTAIRFFTAANGGGFFICFGALPCGNGVFPNGLGTGGPQLYSGPNSAPTLLSGPFTSLPFTVTVNSISYNQANTTLQAAATQHPAFFSGEVDLSAGVYYLQFPNGNLFGYYSYSQFPDLYHFDLGFEYFLDANDGSHGAYLYDFTSGHWLYTSPAYPFPYLYDFTLKSIIYYFPDTKNAGHYTTNPRFFYNFGTGATFTM